MLYYLIQIGSDIMLVKSQRPIPYNADLSHGWPSVGRYPLLDTALFCNYFKDKGLDEALKDSKPYKLPDNVEILFEVVDGVEYPFYKGISPKRKNRITIALMRDLEGQVNREEISYSRMVELLNEHVNKT